MHREHTREAGSSLRRARRMFLMNLGLFLCLAAIGAHLFSGDDAAAPDDEAKSESVAPKAYSRLELAKLKGEMAGLNTHPATVPALEPEWVRKLAEQALRRDADFSHAGGAAFEDLIAAFIQGYTERFEDYYDRQPAFEFGYGYGLKFDPVDHRYIPPVTGRLLEKHRERLERDFAIHGEAEWRVFCDAFDDGFSEGYLVIDKEGVTNRPRSTTIELFEE